MRYNIAGSDLGGKMKKTVKTSKKSKKISRAAPLKAAVKSPVPAGKLKVIRKKLLAMRDSVVRSVKNKRDYDLVEQDIGDAADQASQSIEKEILFELSDNEQTTLDQIEAALRKIENTTYGICESCRKPIAKKRIEAIPFTRYCITCQSLNESGASAPAKEITLE